MISVRGNSPNQVTEHIKSILNYDNAIELSIRIPYEYENTLYMNQQLKYKPSRLTKKNKAICTMAITNALYARLILRLRKNTTYTLRLAISARFSINWKR